MEYEIYHSGIKGMKWGVRRYQNKDGSLTPAGKKRYKKEMDALKAEEAALKKCKSTEKKLARLEDKRKSVEDLKKELDSDNTNARKSDKTSADKAKKKSASEMSDEELDRAINRARKEDEYRRLRPEPETKPKLINRLVNDVVMPAAVNAGRNFMQNAISKAGENLLKGKVDPNSIEALRKTAEKLDLQNRIAKAKKIMEGNDDGESWDEKIKKQTYENNKADRAARMEGYKDAADKAVQERAAANREAARAANEATSREYYNSSYSNKGGERGYVNPNESRSLAVYNSPISSLSKSTVSSGKSSVDSHMNDSYQELIDSNGDVLWSWGGGDD